MSNKILSAIHRLAKEFGLGTAELVDKVNFSVPRSSQFNSVHHTFQPVVLVPVCPNSLAVLCKIEFSVASHPVYSDTLCVNSPAPVTAPELTSPKTINNNLDSTKPAELLNIARLKSLFANTVFDSTNLAFPVAGTTDELHSPPPPPALSAARV